MMQLLPKEIAQDLLFQEQEISKTYHDAFLHCANEDLRHALAKYEQEIASHTVRLYDEMLQRGWSKISAASRQAIESALIDWEQQIAKNPELKRET